MPRVGFKPTIPVFERAKIIYTLDRAAAMIGIKGKYKWNKYTVICILAFIREADGGLKITVSTAGIQVYIRKVIS
jgi:hypothetical protein